jgi:3-hydroxybutyryl-CoA dehydrogenase
MGGGFRMGPFELMDLVGVDVGFEVAKSFTELSFGEPRWKPSPIQARMVAAGRLGRKSGRGYYDYSQEPYRPEDPEPPKPGGGDGRPLHIRGLGPVPDGLRGRASAAGFELTEDLGAAEAVVDADPQPGEGVYLRREQLAAVLCASASVGAFRRLGIVGFNVVPPLGGLVELTGERRDDADELFRALGFHTEWVGDAPGLVLGRIVGQLVNEAAFAIGEGVGSPEDVDDGVKLGLNHPRGPVEWGAAIGIEHVLSVVDGLYDDRHEDRYRAAPALRRAASLGEWPPPT